MLLRSLAALFVPALLSSGCGLYAQSEAHAPPQNWPADYAWPPKTLSESSAVSAGIAAKSIWPPPGTDRPPSSATPRAMVATNPESCLGLLNQAQIDFTVLPATRGVEIPVELGNELGGIRFIPTGGLPLIVDCRFAVTLSRLTPLLRELGVSALHYSGAYVYRMSSKGRLSLHAHGLAIDIHEVTIGGEQLSVKRSFVKGLGDTCESNLPPLNRVACQLKRTGAFRELLTPDYDADHHDHLHLAIAPSPSSLAL